MKTAIKFIIAFALFMAFSVIDYYVPGHTFLIGWAGGGLSLLVIQIFNEIRNDKL